MLVLTCQAPPLSSMAFHAAISPSLSAFLFNLSMYAFFIEWTVDVLTFPPSLQVKCLAAAATPW